jgi:Pretoxin HINT domain
VLSDDPNTPGDIEYKQVLQTFVKETSNLVDIYIDGEKITTTEEHPFWVPDLGWVAAKDLHAGSLLQTKTESWLDVDKVEKHSGLATVYNFEVQGFHTYFVSDLGLLVHNSCEVPVSHITNAYGADTEILELWRAVKDEELLDIRDKGIFRASPYGSEGKYFSASAKGATYYAEIAHKRWPNEGHYTILKTGIPKEFLNVDMIEMDGGIPTYVIPNELLPYLTSPTIFKRN